MNTKEKLQKILEHIQNVQVNAIRLGMKLIDEGDEKLGRSLIANALSHDKSKFFGQEWKSLHAEATPEELKAALDIHTIKNRHHPAHWGSIHRMPLVYVAEMCCDWKARSTEFGTSLLDYINGDAMERFGYTENDEVYQNIMRFVGMMCDKPFTRVETPEPIAS